jgi:hypothetical protein
MANSIALGASAAIIDRVHHARDLRQQIEAIGEGFVGFGALAV